jgi:hypothetical protein
VTLPAPDPEQSSGSAEPSSAAAPKRRWISQEVEEGLVVARTSRTELGLRDVEPVPCLIELAEERVAARCAPPARTVVRRLLDELAAA